jgi:hypothetical protein
MRQSEHCLVTFAFYPYSLIQTYILTLEISFNYVKVIGLGFSNRHSISACSVYGLSRLSGTILFYSTIHEKKNLKLILYLVGTRPY